MRSRRRVDGSSSRERWRMADLGRSRTIMIGLAVAHEHLRVADDLHDMLGHALEVVAFKSELAVRLLDADPARARAEMEDVQRVARESMTEAGAVIRGGCSGDLAAELAGARCVLDSAGVVLAVHGDTAGIGPTARIVLGRVLREAMANVVRHAQPRHCTIWMDVTDGCAHLRVVNDGTLSTNGAGHGTALAALGRYLAEHAGRLDAGPSHDGTFRLDAVVPGAAQ